MKRTFISIIFFAQLVKKRTFISIINCLLLIVLGQTQVWSQDNKSEDQAKSVSEAKAPDSKVTVYIYRYKQFAGWALEPSVYCDEKELAKMDKFVVRDIATPQDLEISPLPSNTESPQFAVESKNSQQVKINSKSKYQI
jgi:hypothetical protein